MGKTKKWIQDALRSSKPGVLRARMRELGLMPKGAERIPRDALERAARGAFGPVTAKRARLALTMRRFRR